MRWSPYTNSKYHNRKIEVGGETFDSQGEYNRWCELKMLERAGQITDLKRQVYFELIPAQYEIDEKGRRRLVERALGYVADYVYTEDGKTVVEDYKGLQTDAFKIKKKLMLYLKGFKIRLTK